MTGRASTRGSKGARPSSRAETPAEKREQTIDLPPSVRFDDGTALLLSWDPTKTPRLEFDSFDIDAMEVEHVVIEAAGPADAEGRTEALRKHFSRNAMLNATRILVGRDGRIVEARHPLLGTTLVIKATDRDTALAPHPAYRLLPNTATRSPFRIPQPATLGHMRYRFAFRAGTQFALPETGEQRVTPENGSQRSTSAPIAGRVLRRTRPPSPMR